MDYDDYDAVAESGRNPVTVSKHQVQPEFEE